MAIGYYNPAIGSLFYIFAIKSRFYQNTVAKKIIASFQSRSDFSQPAKF